MTGRCDSVDSLGRRCKRDAITARIVLAVGDRGDPYLYRVELCQVHDTEPNKPRRD